LAAGPKRVLVIGAGFIGSETASICRDLGLEVTVAELAATPLAGALELAALCLAVLEHRSELRDLPVALQLIVRMRRMCAIAPVYYETPERGVVGADRSCLQVGDDFGTCALGERDPGEQRGPEGKRQTHLARCGQLDPLLANSDAIRPPIPIGSWPPFRFDVGHHSEMKPAT
jgi:hypothetical protein